MLISGQQRIKSTYEPKITRGQRVAAETYFTGGKPGGVRFRLPLDGRPPAQALGRPATPTEKDPAAGAEDVGDLPEGPSVWEARASEEE